MHSSRHRRLCSHWDIRMLIIHKLCAFPLHCLVNALPRTRLIGPLRHVVSLRAATGSACGS